MKLAQVLPELARELGDGLRAEGYHALADSVAQLDIVDRCACEQPGCVTFFTVPKAELPDPTECKRVIAPVRGVSCVQYANGKIVWIEALGRPEDRQILDRLSRSEPASVAADHQDSADPKR